MTHSVCHIHMLYAITQMMKPDFIADLKFLTTEEGGRKTPAHSKYRPHLEFNRYPPDKTSTQQVYIGRDIVQPGEKVQAEMTMIASDLYLRKLRVGEEFKFSEGDRLIGTGKVVRFIREELKEK